MSKVADTTDSCAGMGMGALVLACRDTRGDRMQLTTGSHIFSGEGVSYACFFWGGQGQSGGVGTQGRQVG